MSKRRAAKKTPRRSQYPFDTLVAFMLYAGVAAATFKVGAEARQVVLWCALVVVSLVYTQTLRVDLSHPLSGMARGAAAGMVLSLPVLLLLQPELTAVLSRLTAEQSNSAAFLSMVLVAPFVEEIFFRGLLQKQHGLVASSLLYGVFLLLFYLPGLVDFAAAGLAVALAGGLLGFVYGYVNELYGLGAAMACHAVVNLMLLFLPLVIPETALLLKAT